MSEDEATQFDVVIDGEKLSENWSDQMTFREQRDFRAAVREMMGDPKADVDPEQMAFIDFIPALVYIIRKRKDPDYQLDDVLDCKPSEFLVEGKVEEPAPPTVGAKRTRSPRATAT